MKHVVGDVPYALSVIEDLSVCGTLEAGAVLAAGKSLFALGHVQSSVTLAEGSRLTIAGTFDAYTDANLGRLAVAGAVTIPLELLAGEVVLLAGTLVTIDGVMFGLAPDGSLVLPHEDTDVSLRGAAFRWDANTTSFERVGFNPFDDVPEAILRALRDE